MLNHDEIKEKLAAIEHERWADWQRWVHSVYDTKGLDAMRERWDKQIRTPYSELTEKEKQSDRDQVDRYWPLIQEWVTDLVATDKEPK